MARSSAQLINSLLNIFPLEFFGIEWMKLTRRILLNGGTYEKINNSVESLTDLHITLIKTIQIIPVWI